MVLKQEMRLTVQVSGLTLRQGAHLANQPRLQTFKVPALACRNEIFPESVQGAVNHIPRPLTVKKGIGDCSTRPGDLRRRGGMGV